MKNQKIPVNSADSADADDGRSAATGHRHYIRAIMSVTLLSGVLLWTALAHHYMTASIGGSSVPLYDTNEMLSAAVKNQSDAYRLPIRYPDSSVQKFALADTGISIDYPATVRALRHTQHQPMSYLTWWRPLNLPLVVHTNQVALTTFIATHVTITNQPAQDATLSINKGDIELSNSVSGLAYSVASPDTLSNAARSLQTTPITLTAVRKNPALTAGTLAPYKNQIQQIIHQKIVLSVGQTNINPTTEDIASWLEITPHDDTKKVDIQVNSGKVLAYVNAAAKNVIHPPRDEIRIKQDDGNVSVFVPGSSGVQVADQSDAATQLANEVLQAKGVSLALTAKFTPYKSVTTGDYSKWVEVDLTNKHLYAYEHTTLVQDYPVTAGAPSTPTVTGQYAIYAKFASQNMAGENVDGSNYYQPNVQWINYFYRDYAVHGNYWRPKSYFGFINSSHGCVGLVNTQAHWVYDWAPVGTPVVVHT